MAGIWDQLVDCICRPPRDVYKESELLGGITKRYDTRGYGVLLREDLALTNKRGQALQCSHYTPLVNRGKDGKLPCVVYCHCNSGSKRDGDEAVIHIAAPLGISVFAFDFSGSGLSDGEWVTLGANEVEDLETVITHLRSLGTVSTLGLWGRSMGAVTALLYSQRDPSVAGMVLDSPFSRLTDLMLEIVEEQRLPIPKAVTKFVLGAMRKSVIKKSGVDINTVAPLDVVEASFIPTLFGHGLEDTFIKPHHSDKLYAAYAGDKRLHNFAGDHNSRRPSEWYDDVIAFFHQRLQVGELLHHPQQQQDFAALQQQAAAMYRLHGQASTARAAAEEGTPLLPEGTDVGDLSTMSAEDADAGADEEYWDDDDALLQAVLDMSMLEAAAAASSPLAAAIAPASQDAQLSAAAPALGGDDDDAELRAAIQASLQELQPASLAAQASAPPPPPGTLLASAPVGMLQPPVLVASKPMPNAAAAAADAIEAKPHLDTN